MCMFITSIALLQHGQDLEKLWPLKICWKRYGIHIEFLMIVQVVLSFHSSVSSFLVVLLQLSVIAMIFGIVKESATISTQYALT